MNEEVLKQYEELKRNRDIIKTIEPDFFFEVVDYLVKENETLKNFVSSVFNGNIEKDFIPVQKIKDRIEELKQEKEQLRIDNNVLWDSGIYKLDIKHTVLQELLEEED